MRGLRAWWRRHQREVDIRELWPQLKNEAGGDLTKARRAMYLHCSIDPAWQELNYTERTAVIEGLE